MYSAPENANAALLLDLYLSRSLFIFIQGLYLTFLPLFINGIISYGGKTPFHKALHIHLNLVNRECHTPGFVVSVIHRGELIALRGIDDGLDFGRNIISDLMAINTTDGHCRAKYGRLIGHFQHN